MPAPDFSSVFPLKHRRGMAFSKKTGSPSFGVKTKNPSKTEGSIFKMKIFSAVGTLRFSGKG